MVDHSGPNLYETPDDRVYRWPDALPPEGRITDHVEQVIGKTPHDVWNRLHDESLMGAVL